jgi:N-acyl-D-aspartate/D-glutamate deacylase
LYQGATGYRATILSGQIVAENDKATGVLPGHLIRGAQQKPAA